MTKRIRLYGTVFALFLTFTFIMEIPVFAEVKFGYVDFVRVFNNYKKTVKVEEGLEKKGEKKQKERDELVAKIRKLKDEIELLSDEAKKDKKEEFDKKVKELQEFTSKSSKELLKEKDDAAREIIEEFDKVVKELGKKEDYTFIFDQRTILYGGKAYDLTDEVLKALNKGYKDK